MVYNWQQPDWPNFRFDATKVEDFLLAFAHESGKMSGILAHADAALQTEALLDNLVIEAIKTSEIEGEFFSRQDVVSSIRNNLGLNKTPELVADKKAEGISALMVEVRNTYSDVLTQDTLFHWHSLVMADTENMQIGQWRTHLDAMQVISGPMGKEKVHFEAPPSERVPEEMRVFLEWFNESAPGGVREIKSAPLRAAIAHLYFESIHPFEDGNGRIGRAIAEKALSQTLGLPVLLSISKTIESDKNSYYGALEQASKGNEISRWLVYFTGIIVLAQQQAIDAVRFTLQKTKLLAKFSMLLNERQMKVLRKMLEAGAMGFEGGMNATKYGSLTRISKATATRDLQYLCDIQLFAVVGAGRNTRYNINWAIVE